jgi:hypothetical protein
MSKWEIQRELAYCIYIKVYGTTVVVLVVDERHRQAMNIKQRHFVFFLAFFTVGILEFFCIFHDQVWVWLYP